MPDLKRMASHDRPGDSINDPFDKGRLTGDPFKESADFDPLEHFLEQGIKSQAHMTTRLRSTLSSLSSKIGKTSTPTLISEVEAPGGIIDLEIEDVTSLGESTDG